MAYKVGLAIRREHILNKLSKKHLLQENHLGITKSKSGRGFDLRIFFIFSSALN